MVEIHAYQSCHRLSDLAGAGVAVADTARPRGDEVEQARIGAETLSLPDQPSGSTNQRSGAAAGRGVLDDNGLRLPSPR